MSGPSLLERFHAAVFTIGDREQVRIGELSERVNFARRIKRDIGGTVTGRQLLDWFLPKLSGDAIDRENVGILDGALYDLISMFSETQLSDLTDDERALIVGHKKENGEKYPDWEDLDYLRMHVSTLVRADWKK